MITTRNIAIVAPPAMLAVSSITRCREAASEKEEKRYANIQEEKKEKELKIFYY